jgi:hypothetical protein
VDKLDKQDKKGLAELEKEVETSAVTDVLGGGAAIVGAAGPATSASAAPDAAPASAAPRRVMGPAAPDASQLQAYSQQLHQKDRRDYRKQDREVVEELVGGKATGHERKLEKKMDARAERQAREQSPGERRVPLSLSLTVVNSYLNGSLHALVCVGGGGGGLCLCVVCLFVSVLCVRVPLCLPACDFIAGILWCKTCSSRQ